jgi:hypothetical protein
MLLPEGTWVFDLDNGVGGAFLKSLFSSGLAGIVFIAVVSTYGI